MNGMQIALLAFGALLLLVIGIDIEEGLRGYRAWKRYEADTRRRGVPLTMKEMIPPRIPDSEDFARLPIFDAGFKAAARGERSPNPFSGFWFPEGSAAIWTERRLGLSDLVRQAPLDLKGWQAHFVAVGLLPVGGDDPTADVLQALDHYAGPLGKLHAGRVRQHCQLPVDWEAMFPDPEPYESISITAVHVYALRMNAHLAKGDSPAAYEDFSDSLHLGTATLAEPSFYIALTRLTNTERLLNAVWAGLAAHQWAEPELRKIEADLAALDWLKDYLHAIASERAEFNRDTDLWIADPQLMAFFFGRISMHHGPTDQEKLEWRFYPTGWIYQGKVHGNRYVDEFTARIDVDGRRWISSRPIPSSPRMGSSLTAELPNIVFFRIGSLEENETMYLWMTALTDEARLACALERFRLHRGRYPEKLSELTPDFLPSLPAQVVNGEPYIYRPTEDGSFILYSVGTDLHDDGGITGRKGPGWKQPDWVWRYPAK